MYIFLLIFSTFAAYFGYILHILHFNTVLIVDFNTVEIVLEMCGLFFHDLSPI